ncbi:MAG: dihydrofolate reductase [Candidatus Saccharimonadales bacterium]
MIRLIVAYDRQRGIAKQGFQPWAIPEDEAYFADKTKSSGAQVLMGSTTYKTLKGPLPGRRNFVLTSDKSPVDGTELVHDLRKFLANYTDVENDLWVIGGANVYAQVLDSGMANEIYATEIEADFGCNQFFPDAHEKFRLVSDSELHEQNGFIFRYRVFAK